MEDNIRTEVINAIIDGQSDYAGELIEAHKPEYLYKYRSGKEYDFDTLEKKSVWISRATVMDDDEDGRLYVSDEFKRLFEIAKKENPKFNNTKYDRAVYGISDESKEKVFISSFSELSNDKDMRERYANKNTGFCLEYKFDDVASVKGYPALKCWPISYEKKEPLGAQELLNKNNSVFSTLYKKNIVGNSGEKWIEQREWRWSCFEDSLGELDTENGKNIEVPIPTRILIGKNMPDDKLKKMKNIASNLKIELVYMK